MKEFLLVFRADYKSMPKTSPEQAQANTEKWMNWIAGIAAQNKLANRGSRLESTGQVVKSDGLISDGPYTEIKESIMGYTIIYSESIEEATALSKQCPILLLNGSVEVREISKL